MKGLFKSKPRTPVDIVRQTRDFLIYVDRTSDVRESKREEKMAELSKNIRELKTILYGNSESEPVSEACAQLTAEFFRENTLRLLITCLPKLNLETRKDATQVVANLQRQQVHSKLIASDYLEANIDLLDILITGYENTDMALHYGAMLRECIRHPSIARYVLESQHMNKFFDYIQLPNFDIAADAAATFKELLTRHKSTVAEFLSKNYDWSLINTVFSALLNQAQYALDLKDQLEAMKTKLEIMEAFISCIVKQRTRGVVIQNILPNLRKIIYEADDILTDCQIRDAYQKYGLWYRFSLGGLFFSYQKGKELKYINSRIEKIVTDLQMYGIEQLIIQGPNNPYQIIKHSSSQDYEPSEIIGLENDLEKIKGWTFGSDEELQQIGIVGMGGLGKTTIAQKIFNDIEIAANFEKRIWVSVSQNFCEERIMRVILKELGEDDLGLEESHLLHKIRQLLSDKSCLIVMDDVWRLNLDWWKKLYPTGKSCFTIVTSRYEDVVMRMGVQKSRIHRPKVLNGDESWSLFRKHAFSTSKGKCPNKEFERKGREILKKCGGLPLAIKTIGALLVPKVHSLNEWNKINDAFHELTVQGENNTVVASLQLSYDELPTHLKQCLLCFSIYPEDVEISGEQIVNWWVGEGLIQGKDNLTAMELGFDCLSELVNRCLVEVVHRRGYDGRVYRCKMHNLVRDMTIKIAKDEAFCSFDEQGRQKLAMDSRWLGFRSDMDPKLLKNCTRVRALLLMSSTAFSFRNVKLLRSLRVLDLLESNDVEDLWDWIHSLTRLAFLNLSCVEVPSSIEKLRNLQILVLRRCARLPISITNLKKLIILDVGSCPLRYLPHGLGKLIYLQELSGFRVVSKSNTQSCRLAELLSLTQLRVLRMSVNNESEISEDEWNVLSQLKKLKVLAIDAEDCKEKNLSWMLEKLLPPPSLQELYLRRYRHETLPKWINPKQLSSLQYLCLEDGDISNFEISSESEGSNVSTWVIEGLCLKFLPNLILDWDVLLKDMPILRYAEVSRCFNLKKFPYPFDKPVIWKKNQD